MEAYESLKKTKKEAGEKSQAPQMGRGNEQNIKSKVEAGIPLTRDEQRRYDEMMKIEAQAKADQDMEA